MYAGSAADVKVGSWKDIIGNLSRKKANYASAGLDSINM